MTLRDSPAPPIDLPNPCGLSGVRKLRIRLGRNVPYIIEVRRWLSPWEFYANASSLDAAFGMIPENYWSKVRIEPPCRCPLHSMARWALRGNNEETT